MAMRRGVGIPQPAPAARYKNKNPDIFATFLRLRTLFHFQKEKSNRSAVNYLGFCVSIRNRGSPNNP